MTTEQIKETDPLYMALVIRQRLRNAELIRENYPVSNDGSITLSAAEADILLKHFASFAEKANDLAGQLAATRQQGEKWMRDAKHANDLIGRIMHLFARGQWQVEKQDDQGWIIHSPRVDGVASHTVAFEDSENPAEALLALILDAAIEKQAAGWDFPEGFREDPEQ